MNIAVILIDPEVALDRHDHLEKSSHSLLVGAILHTLYADTDLLSTAMSFLGLYEIRLLQRSLPHPTGGPPTSSTTSTLSSSAWLRTFRISAAQAVDPTHPQPNRLSADREA